MAWRVFEAKGEGPINLCTLVVSKSRVLGKISADNASQLLASVQTILQFLHFQVCIHRHQSNKHLVFWPSNLCCLAIAADRLLVLLLSDQFLSGANINDRFAFICEEQDMHVLSFFLGVSCRMSNYQSIQDILCI